MKKMLITCSSLTALALFSNSIVSIIDTNINNCLSKQAVSNDMQTALFNNEYGYLSNDDWITIQAANKYYSYDTSHANYLLSDGKTLARTLFAVNDQGQLYYKKQKGIIISPKDELNLDNTKQEMISHCKITTMKDSYDPYSNSQYSNCYFTGDNSNWQYMQQGGVAKHIDISQQPGGNKVAHSNNLSETLGLYYIAQAARQKQITQVIAEQLGKFFIAQSTIKNKFNQTLINNIISLIISNDAIYNFIDQTPMIDGSSNLYKNYSLNYIFTENDNLINIYYKQWDNTNNIVTNINWNDSATGSDWNYGYQGWYSNIGTLINWKQYANSWDYFIAMYPTFTFGINSYLQVHNNRTGDNKITNLSDQTSVISQHQPLDLSNLDNAITDWEATNYSRFAVQKQYDAGYNWSEVNLALYLWYDDHNIYFQVACFTACHDVQNEGNSYALYLDNCTFNNIMKQNS